MLKLFVIKPVDFLKAAVEHPLSQTYTDHPEPYRYLVAAIVAARNLPAMGQQPKDAQTEKRYPYCNKADRWT